VSDRDYTLKVTLRSGVANVTVRAGSMAEAVRKAAAQKPGALKIEPAERGVPEVETR
jgi:hypothetical protein